MSASTNWFSSILCNKCFDPHQEARTEMLFENRGPSGNPKKTIVHGLGNLKNKGLKSEVNDLKTQSSTKENAIDCSDIKLQNLETAITTPRFDVELEVVESDFLQISEKFRINSNGQVNGKKALNEKRILIGTDLPPESQKNKEESNDIVCSKYNEKNSIQSAQLTQNKGSYYLKDLGGGDGIYIKAEEKFALENQTIIHYGIGHLITEIVTEKDNNKAPSLKLKFMDGPNEGKERIILSDQVCTFGRLPTCTVVFDEYGVSRIQCKFSYENNQWYVKDGDGYKKSTNGTWILLQDEKLVANKMVFKICNTVFRANVLQSS